MEFVYLTVRCFLHPSCLFSGLEIVTPVPISRASPEIPSMERSPLPVQAPRSKSAGPIVETQIRSSQESQKHFLMINDKLKRTFKNFEAVRNIPVMIKREITTKAAIDQEREWLKLCDSFKECAKKSAGTIAIGKQAMGDMFDIESVLAEDLYVKVLHYRIDRLFNAHVKVLDRFDMFNKHKPMIMYMFQKEYTQDYIIPTGVETYLSLSEGEKLGFLPNNIKTYIPFESLTEQKWTFCCVGLFHSFVHRVNFVSAYWKSDGGEWKSSLVNFDRHLNVAENNI